MTQDLLDRSASSSGIVNLTQRTLTPSQEQLLRLGLGFSPTVNRIKKETVQEVLNKLIRTILLRSFFADDHMDHNLAEDSRFQLAKDLKFLFCDKSTWTPRFRDTNKDTLDLLHNILDVTDFVLKKYSLLDGFYVLNCVRDNLSPNLRNALGELRNLDDVVIKPADKGGAICLLKKSSYIREAQRQLSNTKYYIPIPNRLREDITHQLDITLNRLLSNKHISDRQYTYLSGLSLPKTQDRKFYLLPKIHKDINTWPQNDMPEGRPIVADCETESRRATDYVTYHISELSRQHKSYIKNTQDFIQKIRGQVIHPDMILVTGDITSLYTNMDIRRTVDEVQKTLRSNPSLDRSNPDIVRLLDITLNNNDFKFLDTYYQQVLGMGMGKAYAPNCADLYLVEFDNRAMDGFPQRPLFYHRFIDDIFLIWPGTLDELTQYNRFLNSLLPNITIKLVPHDNEINFLDLTVFKFKDETNTVSLQTKTYFKPTDTHALLHRGSFHPKHVFKGIVKSQILRFLRNSSFREDFNHSCRTLFSSLKTRGYPRSFLRNIKLKTVNDYNNLAVLEELQVANLQEESLEQHHSSADDSWEDSEKKTVTFTILQASHGIQTPSGIKVHPILHPTTTRTRKSNSRIQPVVMPYSPLFQSLFREWKSILGKSKLFKGTRIVAAYTRNKTLGQYLTSSSI